MVHNIMLIGLLCHGICTCCMVEKTFAAFDKPGKKTKLLSFSSIVERKKKKRRQKKAHKSIKTFHYH